MKILNFDMQAAGEKRLMFLKEMDEFHNVAYENTRINKTHTNNWHDKYFIRREFQVGQKVLLYNF